MVKEFSKLENNFAAAASRELQAKVKMSEANGDLAAMEARQRELTNKIKVLEEQCGDAKCTPVITVPANVERHEIDKVFQKMPVFIASGKPAGGEWSFQTLWAYNRVVCNYPPAMAPKATGVAFDSSVYNDKIFGGDVRITYSVTCPKGKMSAVYTDKIIGENPDVSQVHAEISAQLKNWNLLPAAKSAKDNDKAKKESIENSKIMLDETSDLEILEKIVCYESSYNQFSPNNTGFPYADNEMDIGLFQVRTVASVEEHCDVAWDWRHNVKKGVEIYAQKRKESLNHNLSEANPAYGDNVDLQRCIRAQIDFFMSAKLNTEDEDKISLFSELVSTAVCKQRGIPNIAGLRELLSDDSFKDLTMLVNKLRGVPPPLTSDRDAEFSEFTNLQREAIRRYNGGREHKFVIDKTSMEECVGVWKVLPKVKPENEKYVRRVRGKTINCTAK